MMGLKERISHLLEMDVADVASLPALWRHITRLVRFVSRVSCRFVQDGCIQRASALAYASLLAIVPLAALGFAVFSSFQTFETIATQVRDTLLEYLVPTSREVVLDYLANVAIKGSTLSVFGIIGLLITATALLNTMEEAYNHIWRIRKARTWLSKFIVFWATLTFAPILIGASITITSYFTALPLIKHLAEGASYLGHAPFLLPWLMSSLAMAVMYSILPNTRVPFRYALLGGLVGGALFECTKLGFTYYVTEVANYEKIYGALSTLPVFLIWLYLIWVVVLLGAEIVYCLQHPEKSRRRYEILEHAGVRNFYAHLIVMLAGRAHRHGKVLTLGEILDVTDLPEEIVTQWMDEWCDAGLLRQTPLEDETPAWIPGKDLEHLTLAQIQQALNPPALSVPDEWKESALARTLTGLYYRLQREGNEVLSEISINDLLDREDEPPESGPTST